MKEALQLTSAEREALAVQLFESLEPGDPDAEAAWEKEIARRIKELDDGNVKPIPWAKARVMIFSDNEINAQL